MSCLALIVLAGMGVLWWIVDFCDNVILFLTSVVLCQKGVILLIIVDLCEKDVIYFPITILLENGYLPDN